MEEQVRRMNPLFARGEQRKRISELHRLLVGPTARKQYQLVGPDGQTVPIPESIFYLLERLTEVLAKGDAVTVVPVAKKLTTQQAANILNVSRQYLIRLLDDGQIPFTKTGTHRRIRFDDLMKYKKIRDAQRSEALAELSSLSQQFGGYDEIP